MNGNNNNIDQNENVLGLVRRSFIIAETKEQEIDNNRYARSLSTRKRIDRPYTVSGKEVLFST